MNQNSVSGVSAAETAPPGTKPSAVYGGVKRALDLVFAVLALIAAGIPMLIIALIIRLDTRGSAIFTQTRIGRNGKAFACYKFRTMRADAPPSMAKKELENADAFITRTGRTLRNTSLDELPQLFNIIRGDMSFIGPRPLIPEEKKVHKLRDKYGVYQLRPGISGYAQVHGRDLITDEEKAELDRYYLEHFSLKTDVKILFGTVLKVIKEEDIHQGAVETESTGEKK